MSGRKDHVVAVFVTISSCHSSFLDAWAFRVSVLNGNKSLLKSIFENPAVKRNWVTSSLFSTIILFNCNTVIGFYDLDYHDIDYIKEEYNKKKQARGVFRNRAGGGANPYFSAN